MPSDPFGAKNSNAQARFPLEQMGRSARHHGFVLLACSLLTVFALAGCFGDDNLVGIDEWHESLQQAEDPFLLDVRTSEEYRDRHIEGAHHIPHDHLSARDDELPEDKDEPLWLYCRTDRRSQMAADTLAKAGYTDLRVLEGGIIAWEDAGKRTVKNVN